MTTDSAPKDRPSPTEVEVLAKERERAVKAGEPVLDTTTDTVVG